MLIKVAIVDDDVRLAKGLKSDLLEFTEIESVITSSSGLGFARELEEMPSSKRPEIIIMDISMSLADEGISATRQINLKFPEIGVIIFTISDEDTRVFEAFKAGAMGYLLKHESPSFIFKTILDVKNGGVQMSPSIARKTIQFMLPKSAKSISEVDLSALTSREVEVLENLAKGMTYQETADKLFIGLNTIKKHMTNVFEKLQVRNKTEALNKFNKN
jgi:DNA-binding NarL/FixJ family response regulator